MGTPKMRNGVPLMRDGVPTMCCCPTCGCSGGMPLSWDVEFTDATGTWAALDGFTYNVPRNSYAGNSCAGRILGPEPSDANITYIVVTLDPAVVGGGVGLTDRITVQTGAASGPPSGGPITGTAWNYHEGDCAGTIAATFTGGFGNSFTVITTPLF